MRTYRSRKSPEWHAARRAKLAEWTRSNRQKRLATQNKYRIAHPERVLLKQRRHYAKNRNRIRQYFKSYLPRYRSRLRDTNPLFMLIERMRSRIRACLAKVPVQKSRKTFELIGCTPTELKAHIESLFVPGMSWPNRHLWHVDHKRPLASFDLRDPEQQRAAFNYTNLQPLWAVDNRRKSAKLAPPVEG